MCVPILKLCATLKKKKFNLTWEIFRENRCDLVEIKVRKGTYVDFTQFLWKYFVKIGYIVAVQSYSVKIAEINYQQKIFCEIHYLLSNFFSKNFGFTKFLPEKCDSKFAKFPHCEWKQQLYFTITSISRNFLLFFCWEWISCFTKLRQCDSIEILD